MIHQNLNSIEQSQLAASRKHALLRRVVRTEVTRMAIHHRLTHLRNPSHVRIARKVLLDRLDRRILNVTRGRKVRLTCTEVRQVHALGLQLQRRRGDRHGCGNFDAAYPVRKYLGRCRCAHVSSLADLDPEIKPPVITAYLTWSGTFAFSRSMTRGGTSAETSAPKLKHPLDEPRTDIRVLLRRHHKQRLQLRIQLPVHHRHLKLVLIVTDSANAPAKQP